MYRTVDTSTWDDPKVRALPPDGKLLFLYLFTNRHTHVSGIYYLPDVLVCHETGLAAKRLDTLWDTLSKGYLAFRDPELAVVWVRSMFRKQGQGDKHLRAAASHLESLHKSSLIRNFLDEYPGVEQYVADTLSIPHRRGIPQEQEQEIEQDQDADSAEPGADTRSAQASRYVFPVNGTNGKTWALPLHKIKEYEESYPGVAVEAELRKAVQWTRDNPKLRKTPKGMLRFLNSWMGREQNGAAARSGGKGPPNARRDAGRQQSYANVGVEVEVD